MVKNLLSSIFVDLAKFTLKSGWKCPRIVKAVLKKKWGGIILPNTFQLHYQDSVIVVDPLQYTCLENSMDRGAWWAIIDGVTKESDTTERLTHFQDWGPT